MAQDGAFSGAALASQALSELSQTTTQETNKEIGKSIAERRDQERERCPAGFARVDGACRRLPVAEPERAVRRPVAEPARAVPPEKPTATAAKAAPRKIARPAPLPPTPLPCHRTCRPVWDLDPGLWRLPEEGRCWACHPELLPTPISAFTSGVQPALALNIQAKTSTVGFVGGADLTSRNLLFANDGLIAGVTAGYTSSLLKLNTSAALVTGGLSKRHLAPAAGRHRRE